MSEFKYIDFDELLSGDTYKFLERPGLGKRKLYVIEAIKAAIRADRARYIDMDNAEKYANTVCLEGKEDPMWPHIVNAYNVGYSRGADGEGRWISIDDRLPELDEMVWLFENGNIYIGCRCDFDNEGWLWCKTYDAAEFRRVLKKGRCSYGTGWDMAPESDYDYKPSHWMPLPEPPQPEGI